MAATTHDGLIRQLYLAAPRGPLRVTLDQRGHPPYLDIGDVVLVERKGTDGVGAGDFVALRGDHTDIRLVRMLRFDAERAVVFGPAKIEEVPTGAVIGRATEVLRAGERKPLDSRQSATRLAIDLARARVRSARRRVRLQTSLASVYWDLSSSFEQGVSESGDILVTDRCPVGCTFCIYACRPTGSDMSVEMVREAARAFRQAGIPRVRILGGEPFMSVPHLLECFKAIAEFYPVDRIIVLTSGYFGTSMERVKAKVEPLVEAGLRHFHLSFDAYHLERYDVSCYERCLDYCRETSLEAALVVHYSAGLAKDLHSLLALRRNHPFGVRITTVSREGDAKLLSESDTSVQGFEDFRREVLDQPGIELVSEDRSCFRWTVFPGGDVHFCCKQNEENRVGNLQVESFRALQERLRDHDHRNRLNVMRFLTGHKGEVSGNACLTCPLEVSQPTQAG